MSTPLLRQTMSTTLADSGDPDPDQQIHNSTSITSLFSNSNFTKEIHQELLTYHDQQYFLLEKVFAAYLVQIDQLKEPKDWAKQGLPEKLASDFECQFALTPEKDAFKTQYQGLVNIAFYIRDSCKCRTLEVFKEFLKLLIIGSV